MIVQSGVLAAAFARLTARVAPKHRNTASRGLGYKDRAVQVARSVKWIGETWNHFLRHQAVG